MEIPTYSQDEIAAITNNYNKVLVKAQGNEHSLADMKFIIAYQQMKRVTEGKAYWVASPAKETAVSTRVRVTCTFCGEVKSKCPYKAKERSLASTPDCLVMLGKTTPIVKPVSRSGKVKEESYEEKLAKIMFKRMSKEELSEDEAIILKEYEETLNAL